MSKIIDNKFEIGDTVYLKTDTEQLPRIVFSFEVSAKETTYKLACGTLNSVHYDFEITATKNVLINT